MDLAFARRFEHLSKAKSPSAQFLPNPPPFQRLDRLEANQLHFRHVALADWSAFSVDKRIRVFGNVQSNWPEADQVCRAHGGTLLQIESEQENQRISGSNVVKIPLSSFQIVDRFPENRGQWDLLDWHANNTAIRYFFGCWQLQQF